MRPSRSNIATRLIIQRRNSKAQGNTLEGLFSKSFAVPNFNCQTPGPSSWHMKAFYQLVRLPGHSECPLLKTNSLWLAGSIELLGMGTTFLTLPLIWLTDHPKRSRFDIQNRPPRNTFGLVHQFMLFHVSTNVSLCRDPWTLADYVCRDDEVVVLKLRFPRTSAHSCCRCWLPLPLWLPWLVVVKNNVQMVSLTVLSRFFKNSSVHTRPGQDGICTVQFSLGQKKVITWIKRVKWLARLRQIPMASITGLYLNFFVLCSRFSLVLRVVWWWNLNAQLYKVMKKTRWRVPIYITISEKVAHPQRPRARSDCWRDLRQKTILETLSRKAHRGAWKRGSQSHPRETHLQFQTATTCPT